MEAIDSICSKCKHFNRVICDAFPEGVPQEIINTNKHDTPISSQGNNLVFEYDEDYLTKYFSTNSPSS
jgi:hypothetical protein